MMLMLPEKKISFLDIGLASLDTEDEPWKAVTEGEEKRSVSWVTGWRTVVVMLRESRLSDILRSRRSRRA